MPDWITPLIQILSPLLIIAAAAFKFSTSLTIQSINTAENTKDIQHLKDQVKEDNDRQDARVRELERRLDVCRFCREENPDAG